MTEDACTPWWEDISIPALMRAARTTYSYALREALTLVECDDLPKNGAYVIGAIARDGAPLRQIIKALGVTKQAAGQLIDTLVTRGYLERATDPEDRRRLTINLTERGQAAAAVNRAAIDALENQLVEKVGAEKVHALREALAVLIWLNPERCAAEKAEPEGEAA